MTSPAEPSFEPIAIIGEACVLPGALSPHDLVDAVFRGVDLTSEPPVGAWSFPPERVRNDGAVRGSRALRGGYVRGFEQVFSPDGFLLPSEEIAGLDPLFLWILHTGKEALRSAGLTAGIRARAGLVLANLSLPTEGLADLALAGLLGRTTSVDQRNRFMSGLPAHLAARALGLGGGSFALDAACASSLYAMKLACDRLQDREVDLMAVSAASCAGWTQINRGFAALQALSHQGRSRPFDRHADGLVPAQGAACLILERLDDAVRASHPILGVVRGIGLSNDGRTGGFLAPSADGQVAAMRQAYAMSGLGPEDIGLIECHATGTPVGDAVEIASTGRIFAGRRDVPIGSLKSNLGHLLTAAGLAGVIKVLGAMKRTQRPPTLNVDDPIEALAGSPFRLLRAVEPWTQEGPRRAAVSAFGFGGNNAHLLLEEPGVSTTARVKTAPRRRGVAVVAVAARAGSAPDTAGFVRAMIGGEPVEMKTAEVVIPLDGVRFPPRDLGEALPQQTLLLAVAGEAMAHIPDLPLSRTGVFVGMGCDPEAARVNVRLWLQYGEGGEAWRTRAADAVLGPIGASTILGRLPNIVANRLNLAFDARGPSMSVSAEELSGVSALELAMRALEAREIDAAIVGAIDMACSPVHEAAARAVLPASRQPAGDAAVVMVLEREDDARRAGHPIWAKVASGSAGTTGARLGDGGVSLTPRFGHAHAASGLLHVAAGVLLLNHRSWLGPDGRAAPWPTRERTCESTFEALGAPARTILIAEDAVAPAPPLALDRAPARGAGSELRYPAHPEPVRLPPPETALPGRATATPLDARVRSHELVAKTHQAFLARQSEAHVAFVAQQQRLMGLLAGHSGRERLVEGAVPPPKISTPPGPLRPETPMQRPGPKLGRSDLEVLASGRISAIFGPLFERQDGYRRQTRMPMPPLLLADRVTGIVGEPGSMGRGTMWTETDVAPGAWYLNDGSMAGAVLIEAGQADLLLISWLGIDFLNRGERVYRLLGCEVTFLDSLPRPGDRLEFEIHVDGHARQGDVRLFFFHYDGTVNGRPLLRMRGGQAGFFTDEELAASAGVLWSAESESPTAGGRVDAPVCLPRRDSFGPEEIRAFSEGRPFDCFGPGFERTSCHVATPHIAGGRLLLFDRVTHFAPRGGPWGRGYLRATRAIAPDDWFFSGHFLNDPCMPGTLMMEATFQALAFYLTAVGYTLDRDAWRFEPVTDRTYHLRCRGQVTPASRVLVSEVFVDELWDGPSPTIIADVLCTVDGLKAFHGRGLGYRLVRDRPLTRLEAPRAVPGDERAARIDGLPVDGRAILAASWGLPSEAFGPRFRTLDARRAPRLPGPPFLFMSRVVALSGEPARLVAGHEIEAEWDIPNEAFYFDRNGARVVPFVVLLEAALQPCGWLASYAGGAMTSAEQLYFRNLDGTGTVLSELVPGAGTLVTRGRLTKVFRNGTTTIVAFEGSCRVADTPVFRFETVFGFFSRDSLAAQVGLPLAPDEVSDGTSAPADAIDLAARPARFFGGDLRLAEPGLLMLDRITRLSPDGGRKGLGRICAEKTVRPEEWPFKAHFFEDPVQPGSLGIEALIQLLQAFMIARELGSGVASPRFEALAVDRELTWKYRGQVLPDNRLVTTEIEVTEIGRDERGPYAIADGWLWVDGKRIYAARGLAVRIVGGALGREELSEELTLDLASEPWLADHRPTFARPALPLMDLVERAAAAAKRLYPDRAVVAVTEIEVKRWAIVDGSLRLRVQAAKSERDRVRVAIDLWREAPVAALSRFEPVLTAMVTMASKYPPPPPALPPLTSPQAIDDPYRLDEVFHGPAYRLIHGSTLGDDGRDDRCEVLGGVPLGLINHALLDAVYHGLGPHALRRFAPGTRPDAVYMPHKIEALTLHRPTPASGEARCRVRFVGVSPLRDLLSLHAQITTDDGVWADVRYTTRAFSVPRLTEFPPGTLVRFVRDGKPGRGLERRSDNEPSRRPSGFGADRERARSSRGGVLKHAAQGCEDVSRETPESAGSAQAKYLIGALGYSETSDGVTRVRVHELKALDWFPGTVARVYRLASADPETLAPLVAAKDHVARREGLHPAQVEVEPETLQARTAWLPLTRFELTARWHEQGVSVSDLRTPALDLEPVFEHFTRFGLPRGTLAETLFGALARACLERVLVRDPVALAEACRRSVLFLGNHQVQVESPLAAVILPAICGRPVTAIANVIHREGWVGALTALLQSYPGNRAPYPMVFFDQSDRRSLLEIVERLAQSMRSGASSTLVHVEGRLGHACRVPVTTMSSLFTDLALAAEAPIVPFWLAGGLPVEPLTEVRDLPIGYGRQTLILGEPIAPDELRALPLGERRQRVLDAINATGPGAEETPAPPEPALERAVRARMQATGAVEVAALLAETLLGVSPESAEAGPVSTELRALQDALATGRGLETHDEQGCWLARVAAWLDPSRSRRHSR